MRLARRVRAFQTLPFIVGTNPYIKEIYKLYYDSFESLEPYTQDRAENDVEYSEKLKDLVDRHADNIPTLARGIPMHCIHMDDEIGNLQTSQDFWNARNTCIVKM